MPPHDSTDKPPKQPTMMSFAPAPTPIFTWDHRPAVPSPLSSSPIRASSPLSPLDKNALPQRQVQSSPIQQPKFKYATRQARPNPLVRKRAEAQEERRRNFLQSVKAKADDKAWQRRDIEGQFLKNSFLAHVGRLQVDAPDFSEADIDDAVAFSQEQDRVPEENGDEDMVLDDIPEEEELDAMVASYESQQQHQQRHDPFNRHRSPELSDEEGYEDLFEELIAQEQSSADHVEDAIYMDHDEL